MYTVSTQTTKQGNKMRDPVDQAEIDHDHEQNRVAVEPNEDDYDRKPLDIEDMKYQSIVYHNYVTALLSGAELTARDGSTKYSLNMVDTREMSTSQIEMEAKIMASYLVG
jgi:hypothetical protein